ncbi:MAG: hypothetical protein EAZ09_15885 [Oscillatoriales cyanobacterium]|nr:MAG: hypothetical protein EAZ18_15375 [Oscillatoriales cyanobacterium]TAH19606.1 MAG: hypothetical protein EAZ09_15885 [Oscillatoriales cyanobacterium]
MRSDQYLKQSAISKMLHHYQQQAFRPVPPENKVFVEQAGKPVHKRLNPLPNLLRNWHFDRKFRPLTKF